MIAFNCTSSDCTVLAGRHWSVDSPKAVMTLIHGFGEHCGRYAPLAEFLNANGIAVVAGDLRGHGNSPGKRGVILAYENFRDDLAAVLAQTRALYPDVPQVLYGHSMGGGVVLDHGLRGNDTLPIIASAPLIALTDPVSKALRLIVKIMGKIIPKGAITQPIDGTKISNLPDEQARYMDDDLNHGTMGFRLAQSMVETGEHISANAKHWDRPLLLMHSRADQLTSFAASKAFAASAQNVAFHPFDTAQHEMHNDATRDQIFGLMLEFILRQTQTQT